VDTIARGRLGYPASVAGPPGKRLLDAVEAIYSSLEVDHPGRWLGRVLPHVSACVGWEGGGYAHAYDLRGPTERWGLSMPVVHQLPPEVATTVVRCFELSPPAERRHLFLASGPVGTFSAHAGTTFDAMPGEGGASGRTGVRDCAYVNAINPNGDGVLFCVTTGKPRKLGAHDRRRLSMLAAHVAAAQRLLRALVKGTTAPAAIFEADGRVAHVEKAHEGAMPLLRERVLTVDRARGRMRRTDPDRALASWQALLRGEYSTIDRFESDQRRYVVAFVNEPSLLDPRGLTAAEGAVAAWAARGHAEKVIAYELGLAPGTVSALLARAYKKLGVRSRAALVARLSVPTDIERMKLDDGAEVLLFSAPSEEHGGLGALTQTEREVASAAARGDDNRSIAERRGVSPRTIATQLAGIYEKLGVGTRAELARLLLRDASLPEAGAKRRARGLKGASR
jgi:DNA-binding CsgD family transcriptional regulator